MQRIDGSLKPRPLSTMQYSTTTNPGSHNPEASDTLLHGHPRVRVPSHRGGPHGYTELHEREPQVPGQSLSKLQLKHPLAKS